MQYTMEGLDIVEGMGGNEHHQEQQNKKAKFSHSPSPSRPTTPNFNTTTISNSSSHSYNLITPTSVLSSIPLFPTIPIPLPLELLAIVFVEHLTPADQAKLRRVSHYWKDTIVCIWKLRPVYLDLTNYTPLDAGTLAGLYRTKMSLSALRVNFDEDYFISPDPSVTAMLCVLIKENCETLKGIYFPTPTYDDTFLSQSESEVEDFYFFSTITEAILGYCKKLQYIELWECFRDEDSSYLLKFNTHITGIGVPLVATPTLMKSLCDMGPQLTEVSLVFDIGPQAYGNYGARQHPEHTVISIINNLLKNCVELTSLMIFISAEPENTLNFGSEPLSHQKLRNFTIKSDGIIVKFPNCVFPELKMFDSVPSIDSESLHGMLILSTTLQSLSLGSVPAKSVLNWLPNTLKNLRWGVHSHQKFAFGLNYICETFPNLQSYAMYSLESDETHATFSYPGAEKFPMVKLHSVWVHIDFPFMPLCYGIKSFELTDVTIRKSYVILTCKNCTLLESISLLNCRLVDNHNTTDASFEDNDFAYTLPNLTRLTIALKAYKAYPTYMIRSLTIPNLKHLDVVGVKNCVMDVIPHVAKFSKLQSLVIGPISSVLETEIFDLLLNLKKLQYLRMLARAESLSLFKTIVAPFVNPKLDIGVLGNFAHNSYLGDFEVQDE